MNWDQIESKWAAMTRRVQVEWQPRGDAAKSAGTARRQTSAPLAADLVGAPQPGSGTSTAE